MATLPVSSLFSGVDLVQGEVDALQKELDCDVAAYTARRREDLGIQRKEEEWRAAQMAALANTRHLARKFLEEVFEGVHGRGILVLLTGEAADGYPRLARIIELEQLAGAEKCPSSVRRFLQGGELDARYHLLNLANMETATVFHNCRWPYHFAEVTVEGTSEEEFCELFLKLKGGGGLETLLRVFQAVGHTPTLEAGERIPYGSSSHHSGEMIGWAIVLPTGRLAVFSEFQGDSSREDEKNFWGVATLETEVSWSAKAARWEGSPLAAPTTEELAFLVGKKEEECLPELTVYQLEEENE